jgi:penicillin amidase
MPVINETSIGFISVGRLVIRDGNPDDSAFIKEGWTGENEWLGYVSLNDQPRFIDPPKGFFCMGNNKFLPDTDKYHLSWNTNPTSRARRIYDLISELINKVLNSFIN